MQLEEKNISLEKRSELLNRFIDLVFDDKEIIWFRFIHDYDKEIKFNNINARAGKSEFEKQINELVFRSRNDKPMYPTSNNKKGYAMYFTVNSGGTTADKINKINAYFGDADLNKHKEKCSSKEEAEQKRMELLSTGKFVLRNIKKDINEKTFDVEMEYKEQEVEKRKKTFLNRFKKELENTLIVETKNGFHIYWLLDYKLQFDDFEAIEKEIIEKFDGWLDNAVHDLPRILRLPYFYHMKDKENPFLCQVVQWTEKKWTRFDLFNHLGLTGKHKVRKKEEAVKTHHSGKKSVVERATTKLEFKKKTSFKAQTMTEEEFITWVKRQPLTEFIANKELEGVKFHCFFHKDINTPSANLHTSDEGIELYICHGGCSRKGRDLIAIYQATTGKKFNETVKALAKLANVTIEESKFQLEQYRKYRLNRKFIDEDIFDKELFEESFEFLPKYFNYSKPNFYMDFNDYAERQVKDEEFSVDGESVFFVSYDKLRQYFKRSYLTTYQVITLFALLGLVKKIHHDKVPKNLINRAKMELKTEDENIINFYTIPQIQDVIEEAENIAKVMKENKFTMKNHLNKRGIQQVFGEEMAELIYPNTHKIARKKTHIEELIEKRLLKTIEKDGYCLEKDFLSRKFREKGKDKRYRKDTVERAFKVNIPAICEAYGLERKMLSKTLKEELKIDIEGRPYIILKK